MPALQSGNFVGPYHVLGLIGSGGMGQVYRARDTKLKRDVAIKVLPEELSRDPERIRRFRREAEVLATLNHSNIAQIYGLEESDGNLCLILEFVEGETVADRLRRGAIPVEEALEFAVQIAQGLEAAHERDLMHRDLKLANIKITPEGKVKVLDFGLAKAVAPEEPDVSASQSPTLVSGTGAGVILGTAAYMSPEQAKGRKADTRSDIWAFGVVLYEMLAGKPAFSGETVTEILAAVLRADLDWTALPETTPLAIRSLLKRCLQRDRNRRLRDIADARFQIEETLAEPVGRAIAAAPVRKSRERVWIAALIVVIAVLAANTLYNRSGPTDAPEMRLQIVTPPGANLTSFAISPDGRKLVFQAPAEGRNRLWMRPLESETAEPLAGTENGVDPFWSPDSQSIGFFADGQLKRVAAAGGPVQTLTPASNARGGTWSSEGVIVFAASSNGPLYRMRAGGGQTVEATRLDPQRQTNHRFPHFLPDGRHFLFSALGTADGRGVHLGSIDSMDARRLFDADAAAVFSPPDYVLFARQGALLAQRLDLDTWELASDPLPVAERVAVNPAFFEDVALSASSVGTVAYRAGAAQRQLVWLDRSGRQIGVVGAADGAQPAGIRLSPDGRTVALRRTVSGNSDIWLIETLRGVLRRFTLDTARDYEAIWSSDGSRIVFTSDRKGVLDLYEKPVNGAATETLLMESPEQKNPRDWSSDGRFILYDTQTPTAGADVLALPLFGDRKPLGVEQTAFSETNSRFSPEGRWIAYQSNETGRIEVYVQPFPGPGGKSQISTNGGMFPEWRRDGRELFYLGPDNRLMAVPVTLNTQTVEAGTPAALFSLQPGFATSGAAEYAPSPDGQRFLVNTVIEEASPITILLNWKPQR